MDEAGRRWLREEGSKDKPKGAVGRKAEQDKVQFWLWADRLITISAHTLFVLSTNKWQQLGSTMRVSN